LIVFIASTLGLSAVLLKGSPAAEAVLVLLQAGCVLVIVALLEWAGRGKAPR
jgi:hypothetical protein